MWPNWLELLQRKMWKWNKISSSLWMHRCASCPLAEQEEDIYSWPMPRCVCPLLDHLHTVQFTQSQALSVILVRLSYIDLYSPHAHADRSMPSLSNTLCQTPWIRAWKLFFRVALCVQKASTLFFELLPSLLILSLPPVFSLSPPLSSLCHYCFTSPWWISSLCLSSLPQAPDQPTIR